MPGSVKWVGRGLLLACVIGVTSGCGSSGISGTGTLAPNSPALATSLAATAMASVPGPSSAGVTTPPAPTLTPPAAPATQASATDGFVMPDEVGKILQTAQDDLQRVSGNPLYYSSSSDASGADRLQVLDRNWKVCSQNVAPGAMVNSQTTVDFAVVKLDESCP